MNAMLNTHPANAATRRRILNRATIPLPLWQALRAAEMERRHRALVDLEALHRETPWWCLRQRFWIRRAISAHLPVMWS